MASIPTQEEVLAATRKSQEAMIATIRSWLETVRTVTPRLTSVYAPLTGKLPRLPAVSLPLPTPGEAVASAYELAEQLLASQRRFAEELLRATAPLRPGHGGSAPEAPAANAWQDAVAVAAGEPKPTAARAAAKSTAARAAAKSTAAKSTAAKSSSKSTAAKSTAAKSAGASRAPKGTDAG